MAVGFVLFVPAADPNTFDPVPGVAHRYKITNLTVNSSNSINATILWDEGGVEVDKPLNGSLVIISEKGAGLGLGFPVSQQVYGFLLSGMDQSAIIVDERSRVDGAEGSSAWIRYPLSYTDFSDPGYTKSATPAYLPGGAVITGVKIKHSVSFTGGTVSGCSVSVGTTGNLTKFASPFDVFAAPAGGNAQLSLNLSMEDQVAPTPGMVTASSTGETLNHLTAGDVEVWVAWAKAS